MSSSPSRARVPSAASLAANLDTGEVLPFFYAEVAAVTGHGFALTGESDGAASASRGVEREAQLRELGHQQGAAECRAKFDEQLAAARGTLAQALKDFSRDRAAYYQKLEEEAVRLALSIARKVLHRESQVDPALLMGIVRVALERVEGATGVALLVHPQQAGDWRRYLTAHLDPGDLPEIVEDPAMRLEECALRTSMGTADLGLEVQLKEIELGLMDLLAARPQGQGK